MAIRTAAEGVGCAKYWRSFRVSLCSLPLPSLQAEKCYRFYFLYIQKRCITKTFVVQHLFLIFSLV